MTDFDSVEKLRERASVSYEDAKAALDACAGDLLDALIYLEKQGKVAAPSGGSYTSKPAGTNNAAAASAPDKTENREGFRELMKRFFAWCVKVFHYGNTNYFEVIRAEQKILSVPITVLALLLMFAFWVTIPLIVIGLFLGCRYSFVGSQIEKIDMNRVMDSAAGIADKVKSEVKTAQENYQQQNQRTDKNKD